MPDFHERFMTSQYDQDDMSTEQSVSLALADMPAAPVLTGKQKRALKAHAHSWGMKPVVMVGHKGVTDALTAETHAALLAHELIKVRFQESVADERKELAAQLADATASALVNIMGHTALFYRAHPEKPDLRLPKA